MSAALSFVSCLQYILKFRFRQQRFKNFPIFEANFCFLPYFVLIRGVAIVNLAQKVFNNVFNINISFQQCGAAKRQRECNAAFSRRLRRR